LPTTGAEASRAVEPQKRLVRSTDIPADVARPIRRAIGADPDRQPRRPDLGQPVEPRQKGGERPNDEQGRQRAEGDRQGDLPGLRERQCDHQGSVAAVRPCRLCPSRPSSPI
jgi:hypothetical protein